jgi:hypothetical protein
MWDKLSQLTHIQTTNPNLNIRNGISFNLCNHSNTLTPRL